MMLVLKSNKTIDQLKNDLSVIYPEFEINKKNKSTLYIRNEKIIGIVRAKKDNIYVHGDINLKNHFIIILTVIGILFAIVGVIIVYGILYAVYGKNIKHFRQDIYNRLSEIV